MVVAGRRVVAGAAGSDEGRLIAAEIAAADHPLGSEYEYVGTIVARYQIIIITIEHPLKHAAGQIRMTPPAVALG
jgi:hypothetical protein